MSPRFFPLMALLLSACAPLTIYHKPGIPVSRMQSDQTACEVSALKDAPVAPLIRQYPPIYYPGHRVCNASGTCWTTPGYWEDGGFYTVDANKDLRNRVLSECMARKGYRPVTIPSCSPAVKSAAPIRQTTVLPRLTPQSCAIRRNGGGWQIVTPRPAPG